MSRQNNPNRSSVRNDYKVLLPRRRHRRPALPRIQWPWFALGLILPVIAISVAVSGDETTGHPIAMTASIAGPASLEQGRVHRRLALPPAPEPEAWHEQADGDEQWVELRVRSGDSLATLMERQGVRSADWLALTRIANYGQQFNRLYPGDTMRIQLGEEGRLQGVYRPIDEHNSLLVQRDKNGALQPQLIAYDLERRIHHASGRIRSSLFFAGREAGLSDAMTMELANIFAWDIDFALDIREGDSFTMLYEAFYRDGERVRTGNVLAAEFNNRNRRFRAIRFTDPEGNTDYYTPEGNSVRREFIRTPVDFTRISSRFNPNRRHPILNRIRAHRGVDYAAPRGTPIKAAGDGRIIHRGPHGGYGNTIIIEHAGRYTTLYAHMNGFARGIGKGTRVRQGQVIGYVGDTGLATAPHLHYEFRVDGVHKDPLKVDLPSAKPLAADYHNEFRVTAEPLLAQLDVVHRTLVATQGD